MCHPSSAPFWNKWPKQTLIPQSAWGCFIVSPFWPSQQYLDDSERCLWSSSTSSVCRGGWHYQPRRPVWRRRTRPSDRCRLKHRQKESHWYDLWHLNRFDKSPSDFSHQCWRGWGCWTGACVWVRWNQKSSLRSPSWCRWRRSTSAPALTWSRRRTSPTAPRWLTAAPAPSHLWGGVFESHW